VLDRGRADRVVPVERPLETLLERETRLKSEFLRNFCPGEVQVIPLDADAVHCQQGGFFYTEQAPEMFPEPDNGGNDAVGRAQGGGLRADPRCEELRELPPRLGCVRDDERLAGRVRVPPDVDYAVHEVLHVDVRA